MFDFYSIKDVDKGYYDYIYYTILNNIGKYYY